MKYLILFLCSIHLLNRTQAATIYPGVPAGGVNLTNLSIDNDTYLKIAAGLESGMTFSNVNRFGWTNTLRQASGLGPITVATVGDGLVGGTMLQHVPLMYLTNRFPLAGYLTHAFPGAWFTTGGSAVSVPTQNGLWCNDWIKLTTVNDTATLTALTGNGFKANAGVVIYLAEAGAGHFLVETQINNGTWTTVSGLASTDSSSGTGIRSVGWTNSAPAAPTRIRVTDLDSAKTVKVIDIQTKNTSITNGLLYAIVTGAATVTYDDIYTTNSVTAAQMWQLINPTLILFEKTSVWDDTAPNDFTTSLQRQIAFWCTNNPNADQVLCGIYPNAAVDTDSIGMRTNAILYGISYFDGLSPFQGTNTFAMRGWYTSPVDFVHASSAGYTAYDYLLSHWLGLSDYSPTIKDGTLPTLTLTAAATLDTSYYYIRCDTTSAGFTVTVPATPRNGQTYIIKKMSSDGNTLTVSGNGHNIDGTATKTTTTQYTTFHLWYDSVSTTWNIE